MISISEVTDEGLQTLIDRYRERRLTIGGRFSLQECLLEQKKRAKSEFDGKTVFDAIVELSKLSDDCLLTYGQLHNRLSGGKDWAGNYTQSQMSRALDKAIYYCIANGLPIVTVLVVRANERLSPQAVQNIYDECKELGLNVGLNADEFVSDQIGRSKEFIRKTSTE